MPQRETYNPNTGVSSDEKAGGTYNRETGDYAYGSSRTATGAAGEQVSSEHGTVGGPGGVSATGGETTVTNTHTGQSTSYATSNGNVYKNSGSGWEKQTSGGWQSADAGASSSLDRQQSFQSAGDSRSSGGGWGGGMGGGGGAAAIRVVEGSRALVAVMGGGWGGGGGGSFSDHFGGGGFRGSRRWRRIPPLTSQTAKVATTRGRRRNRG